jgi:hypothetical protein
MHRSAFGLPPAAGRRRMGSSCPDRQASQRTPGSRRCRHSAHHCASYRTAYYGFSRASGEVQGLLTAASWSQ